MPSARLTSAIFVYCIATSSVCSALTLANVQVRAGGIQLSAAGESLQMKSHEGRAVSSSGIDWTLQTFGQPSLAFEHAGRQLNGSFDGILSGSLSFVDAVGAVGSFYYQGVSTFFAATPLNQTVAVTWPIEISIAGSSVSSQLQVTTTMGTGYFSQSRTYSEHSGAYSSLLSYELPAGWAGTFEAKVMVSMSSPPAVPEPTTLASLLVGLAALSVAARRRSHLPSRHADVAQVLR